MTQIFLSVIPIYSIILIGILARKFRFLQSTDRDLLFKLVINISVPALILSTFSTSEFKVEYLKLSLVAAGIMLVGFFVGKIIAKTFGLDRKATGTAIISQMNSNTGLSLAVVLSILGAGSLMQIEMFNRAHSVILFTLVYFVAIFFGGDKINKASVLRKILLMPPLVALIIGILLNTNNIAIPQVMLKVLDSLGSITMPLSLIGVGLAFEIPQINFKEVSFYLAFFNLLTGICVAFLLGNLLNIDRSGRQVALLMSAAPVGVNTLIFSQLEKLDVELAKKIVSISLLIFLVFLPIVVWVVWNLR